MRKGDTLKNGAKILAATPIIEECHLVLADNGGFEPFVTWVVDVNGSAHWGHYFQYLGEAVFDYENRVTAYKAREA